jgi:peroxin-12
LPGTIFTKAIMIDNGPSNNMTTFNPGSPTSLGALLAEENAMKHPNPALPSFLEQMFMNEATNASRQAITMGMNILQQYLRSFINDAHRQQQEHEQRYQQRMNNVHRRLDRRWFWFLAFLQKWRLRILRSCQDVLSTRGREILVLLMYWLERQCLLTNQATLSEMVYGGRRVQLGTEPTHKNDKSQEHHQQRRLLLPADRHNLIRLALWMALEPYLAERLNKYYQSCQQELLAMSSLQQTGSGHHHYLDLWKRWFTRIYPLCSSAWQLYMVGYQWRYMVGRSVFFDPISHLLQLVVVRQKQQQSHQKESEPSTATPPLAGSPTTSTTTTPASTTAFVPTLVAWILSTTLVIGWLHQFRSEWAQQQQQHLQQHGRNFSTRSNIEAETAPGMRTKRHSPMTYPPPPSPPPRAIASTTQRRYGTCSLCHQPCRHPTACITSGQVYCYKCLKQYLQEKRATARQDDFDGESSGMIRLYESYHPPAANDDQDVVAQIINEHS